VSVAHLLPRPDVEALRAKLAVIERALRDEDGLAAVDQEMTYLYWSRRIEALTGLSADRVLGRPVLEVFPSLRGELPEQYIRDALGGRAGTLIGRQYHIPQTGRSGVAETRYLPWCDEAGRVIAAMIVMRDLAEEQRVRQRLDETESRFRNMADHSPVMLWMSGADSLCNFFNATWLAFTGKTLDQELGVGWAEGVHHEDFQRCMDTYIEAFSERRQFEMEYRLRRADGQWRVILDRGTPRFLPSGEFAGYIGSCVDITEHKSLEQDLRQGVRDRDDFLSIASHELKTPLTTLQFAVDAILRGVRDRPDEALRSGKLLAAAQRASGHSIRLATLVDELLDVSRLSARQLHIERAPADLAAIASDVALRIADAAAAAGCVVDLDVEEGVTGHWDRARIERLLVNLVSNAIKYGAGKPVRIEVHPAGTTHGVVSVRDQGIGIAEADQARIFDRFERAVSARNYGGFGLGLWIAREIVRAHGGHIAVASRPGEGATFTVTLDRAERGEMDPSV
jgi:PAS domain S-box-containing protein